MDKDTLLERLKSLESSLPADSEVTPKGKVAKEKANLYFSEYYERLLDDELSAVNYDKEALSIAELERDEIQEEISDFKKGVPGFEDYHSKLEEEISDLESEKASLESIIPNMEIQISDYDRQAESNVSETEKASINKNKVKRSGKLEEYKKRIEEIDSLLTDRRTKKENVERELKDTEEELIKQTARMEEVKKRISEIRNNGKLTPEQREALEADVKSFHRLKRYFSVGPKEKLGELIENYESGRISEAQVTRELTDIKSALSSNLYNLKDVNVKLSEQAIEERRERLRIDIEELTSRVNDDAWYYKSTPEHDEQRERIIAYEGLISEERDLQRRAQEVYDKRQRKITRNQELIEKHDEWIKNQDDRIEIIRRSIDLPQSEKDLRISRIEETKERYAVQKERLVEKNKMLVKKQEPFEGAMAISNLQIKRWENKEEECRERLYTFDQGLKERDEALLEEKEALLLEIDMHSEEIKSSFEEELDGVIESISGKEFYYEEKVEPTFVNKLSNEAKSKYDEIISGMTVEEKRKLEEELNKLSTEDKELAKDEIGKKVDEFTPIPNDRALATIPEQGLATIPDGKPIRVRKFKDIVKEKLLEIKEWFKENWKKVVLRGAIVAACVATLVAVTCKKNDTYVSSEPTYKVTAPLNPSATPTPTATSTPEITPTETPEVTPTPGITSTPTPEITPSPTPETKPTSTPTITPTPTPEVTPTPDIETSHEYYLERDAPEGLGDTHPADEDTPYLDGNAVYNPETNTWVDSDGTKITGHEDGTFSVEQDAETPEEVSEDVTKLTDPDMSAVEEEKIPEESQTVEEALENGEITETEANELNNKFDDLFAALEEEQGRGR